MAQGLQFFDASGNLLLDITHRVLKFLGQVTTTANVNGSVVDADFTAFSGATAWAAVIGCSIVGDIKEVPKLSIVGNTLSWTYAPDGAGVPVTIAYGIW